MKKLLWFPAVILMGALLAPIPTSALEICYCQASCTSGGGVSAPPRLKEQPLSTKQYLLLLAVLVGAEGGRYYLDYRVTQPMRWTGPTEITERIEFETVTGEIESWEPTDQEAFVVVFSTACRYCQRAFPAWREAYERECQTVEFVALTDESERNFEGSWIHGWEATGSCPPPRIGRVVEADPLVRQFNLAGVPTAFLVSETGRVMRSWRGARDAYTFSETQ